MSMTERAGQALPPLALVVSSIVAYAIPRGSFMAGTILWGHYAAIAVLFLFLMVAELFQLQAWIGVRRGAPVPDVARAYGRLWTATVLVPAPSAILILVTGLRLIAESPETNSLSQLWLSFLVVAFGLFFWDGMLGYRPTVKGLRDHWVDAPEGQTAAQVADRVEDSAHKHGLLFLHAVSFPIVFLVGVYRWHWPNPVSAAVLEMEQALTSWIGAGAVVTALLLFAVAGAAVFAAHRR